MIDGRKAEASWKLVIRGTQFYYEKNENNKPDLGKSLHVLVLILCQDLS